MMNEYKAEGFIRPLTLAELLKVIPHMTNLIWRCEGQYALRDMVCALSAFPALGTPDKAWILRKYFV